MDRKAWIILALCGILLALNVYFQPKPQPVPLESTPQSELSDSAQNDSGDTDSIKQTSSDKEPGLVVEPHVPLVGETIVTLSSYGKDGEEAVKYTFTSRGGGLKTTELFDEFAVGSKTEHVILNQDAPAPVGALCVAPDDYLALDYTQVEEEGAVVYTANTNSGLKITKRWTLEEDKQKPGADWLLNLSITFENTTSDSKPISLSNYSIFTGSLSPLHAREWENQGGLFYLDDGSLTSKDSNWFRKGFLRKSRSLYQESVEDLQYAGVSNQFFTSLVRPSEKYTATVWAKTKEIEVANADIDKPKRAIRLGFSLPAKKIVSNESSTFTYSIYSGPKDYSVLKKMEEDTSSVMNYGWFTIVSVVLNNVLNWFHDVVFSKFADNWAWGLSVIALTILIRICIWPLHNKSSRTMKRMSKLQPIIKELREKHADNPNKLNQETMKLYRDYKVNPMGGCLPMFLQIPIFFGYYKMLQFAVELRGESFLWVQDLSMPDTLYTFDLPFALPLLGDQIPVNVLPILMAVTMLIQMKLTPKTGDAMQQKIFMLMPLMFFFFCYNFAAALALYWTTQNIFSIGQTWLTNRMPEPDLVKPAPKKGDSGKPRKKTFMERMTEKAEEMQRIKDGGAPASKKMRDATPDSKKKKRSPKTGG